MMSDFEKYININKIAWENDSIYINLIFIIIKILRPVSVLLMI